MISGLLAGGSPGFRTVLCCFLSQLLYGDFVCDVSLLLVFCFLAIPIQFIMRSHYLFEPCCMALCHCASFLCGVLVAVLFAFGFCFLCSFCFACFVGFSAHLYSDSLLDCVLVLRQHYFCGPSLNDGLITMPELMKHVACQESVWIDLAKAKRRMVGKKGKIVITKTSRHKGLVLGSFLVPEIDMIFGDGVVAYLECITVESAVWRETLNQKFNKERHRHTERHVKEPTKL